VPGDERVLPRQEEKTEMVRAMFDTIAPRYEMVNRVMTMGLDSRWRTRSVTSLGLPRGSTIVDLACGTGDLSRTAASLGFNVIGMDLSFGMLHAAHGVDALVQADGASLPLGNGVVDGLVCGYALRNFTDLAQVFREMARVVRPGGRIALLEVGTPRSQVVKAGYSVWFERVVPTIGGLLSDKKAYRYLPASTVYLPRVHEVRASLVDCGFSGVNHHELSGGLSQLYTATRTQ